MSETDAVPKITVVVAVYNAQAFIRRCVESITAQTLREIEIILVDDGSTDASGALCDELAQTDSRIRVIHQENKGVSEARNTGVAHASAPYIMFVDNDDRVEPDFCERLYRMAQEQQADLVYFMHDCTNPKGKTWKLHTPFPDGVISEKDALYINNHISVTAWSFLYDKKLFDGRCFPKGRAVDDLGVTHRFIHAATKICLINDALYHYTYGRPDSAWNTLSKKLILDVYETGMIRIRDLESWGYGTSHEKHLCYLFYLAHAEKKRHLQQRGRRFSEFIERSSRNAR